MDDFLDQLEEATQPGGDGKTIPEMLNGPTGLRQKVQDRADSIRGSNSNNVGLGNVQANNFTASTGSYQTLIVKGLLNANTANAALFQGPSANVTTIACQTLTTTANVSSPHYFKSGYEIGGVMYGGGTISSSSTLDITLANTFTVYKISLINFQPASDSQALIARVSIDGSTFETANYSWHNIRGRPNANNALGATYDENDSDDSISLAQNQGSGSNQTGVFEITVTDPGMIGRRKRITYNSAFVTAGGDHYVLNGAGSYTGTNDDIVKIRFKYASGNISTGKYKILAY